MFNIQKIVRVLLITIMAAMALGIPGAARACCPDTVEGLWSGQYFANTTLTGTPVLTRIDSNINFEWGVGAPATGLPVDGFGVRWTRDVFFAAGLYDFVVVADDGTRVQIGDRLVIDNWRDMQGQPIVQRVFVPGGYQRVTVEYFEGQGGAKMQFFWAFVRGGWLGEYWDNTSLSGDPIVSSNDPNYINYAEGVGWPPTGVPTDSFSVRWLKSEWFPAGTYVFKAETDTGLRMWVDSALVINRFDDTADKGVLTATVTLTEGVHDLRVDYFQNGGIARVNVWWELQSLLPEWTAYYYNNPHRFGGPVFVQSELSPVFNAGIFSPAFGVNHNEFSARWMKNAAFAVGSYRFGVVSDDGVAIFVAGNPVLNALVEQNATFHQSDPIAITAGTHLVTVDYFEMWDNAQLKVWWAQAPATGATAVSDESSGSVIRTGSASAWQSQSSGYGGHSYYLNNVTSAATASAEWHMALPDAGQYEVLVYIPGANATTRAAQYSIEHNGAIDQVTLNQSQFLNQWVSLGTFQFSGSGAEVVSMNNATGEASGLRTVAIDELSFRAQGESLPDSTSVAVVSTTPSTTTAATGQYVVQAGDTFYRIARSFGVNVSLLIAANPQVPAPNFLRVGEVLTIP